MGGAIKSIFENMTEYDLTNYFTIPLGKTSEGKSVYLRCPLDETGRFVGGVFWKMLHGNFNLAEGGLADYMAGQAPTVHPLLDIGQDVLTYFSGNNPYDSFRGRYAIPDQVWKAQDWRTAWAFTKFIANKAGIGLVYRFKTENDVEIKGTLERIVGFPFLNNILGRFIKITDYGAKEHIRRDVLGPVQKQRAREILDANTAISKMIAGKAMDQSDWMAIMQEEMKGSQIINRTVMSDIAKRYGTVYSEALMGAGNIQEKIAILQDMAKKEQR